MTRRRLGVLAGLGLGAAPLVFAVGVALAAFPRGIAVLAGLALAVAAGWYGLRRRGAPRALGLGGAVLLAVRTVVVIVLEGDLVANLLVVAGAFAAVGAASVAFSSRAELPPAPSPA